MNCPKCGAAIAPGSPSLWFPRRRAGDGRRPVAVTLLALVNVAVGAGVLALATLLATYEITSGEGRLRVRLIVATFLVPLGLLPLAAAVGLWRLRSWGRNLQLVLVSFFLLDSVWLVFCLHFVFEGVWVLVVLAAWSAAVFVYLWRPTVRSLFPGRSGRWFVAVAGGVLGTQALIAFTTLPPPKHVSANESATIGDIRTVISAQAAYAQTNGGFYDRLQCLGEPVRCLPGYRGSHFLDSVLASGAAKSGYARTFHPGPLAPPDAVVAARVSPSSLKSYAYVAVPIQIGRTGVRGFCGDSTGFMCFTANGTPPPVREGQCVHREPVEGSSPAPSECQTLQ